MRSISAVCMAKIQFCGIVERGAPGICSGIPIGRYILEPAGFGLGRIDEAEASAAHQALKDTDQLTELESPAKG